MYIGVAIISFIISVLFVSSPLLLSISLIIIVVSCLSYKNHKLLVFSTCFYIVFYSIFDPLNSLATRGLETIIFSPIALLICVSNTLYLVLNIKSVSVIRIRDQWIKLLFIMVGLLILCVLIGGGIVFLKKGGSGISTIYFPVLIPILLFARLLLSAIKEDITVSDIGVFIKIFLGFALLNALMAVCEYLMRRNLFYDYIAQLSPQIVAPSYYGFKERSYRVFTLAGHPLRNAGIFLVGMMFALTLKRWRYLFSMVFLLGILLTLSRVAFLLAASLMVIYFLLKFRKNSFAWFFDLWGLIFVCCITAIILLSFHLGQDLISRFVRDEASSRPRIEAIQYVSRHVLASPQNYLLGGGVGASIYESSLALKNRAQSFELGLVMMLVDYGIVLTLLSMIFIIVFLQRIFSVRSFSRRELPLFLASLGILIQANSYNGLLTVSPASLFVCFVLGLALANYYLISRLKD